MLSLEKMNKILEINEDGLYAVVQPGVRTSEFQSAVEAQGLFYAEILAVGILVLLVGISQQMPEEI